MSSEENEDLSEHDRQLGEIISHYLKVVEAGAVPNRSDLLNAHPSFASALAEFIADRERMERLASPLRLATRVLAELPDLTGTRIGAYEIVEQLGQGGMGIVFAARQDRPRRLVALKMIHAGSWAMRQHLQRFREESEILARLRHPNIVRVYEVGEHECRPYFTMDLAAGNLAQKLAAASLAPRHAALLLQTLAQAVGSAHEQGIVHRDLKPSNILLTADGTPLIADFGLAKQLQSPSNQSAAGELTVTGAIVGTPSYMAPEQTTGSSKAIGPATDVYALGAILYECLVGRAPFKAATPLETLEQIRSQDPVPLSRLHPNLPRDLQTITLKCLEKDQRRRYATALELAADLTCFLQGKPIAARPVGSYERVWKWARRNPATAALAAVTSGSLIAFVVGAFVHDRQMRSALGKAEANEAKALEQHELADVRYRAARDSMERILDHLNAPRIATVPRLKEIRREMQEDLLAFYQSLLDHANSPDPAVRFDSAFAYEQTAKIQSTLGHPASAEENLQRALTLTSGLPEEYRMRPDVRNLVALCHGQLAGMAFDNRRPEEAEAHYRESFLILDGLAREQPKDPKAQNGLATAEHNLGVSCQLRQRLLEAEKHYLRSVAIRSELVRDHPEDQGYASSLAETRCNLGLIYAGLRRSADGAAEYEKAAAVLKLLAERHPEVPLYAMSLAGTYNNWGNLLREAGKPTRALAIQTLAINLAEQALQQEPRFALAQARAFNAYGSRAQVYESQYRWADAVKDWDRVVALDTWPNPWMRRLGRAAARARAGDHARAAAEAESLEKDSEITDEGRYNLAVVYGLALKALESETGATVADIYAGRALALLQKLQVAGFFREPATARLLATDQDLSALRIRSEFRHLMEVPGPKK